MLTLRSLATDHPEHDVSPRDTAMLLAGLDGRRDWHDAVAETGVRRRSAVLPADRLPRLAGVGERNALYGQLAPALAERAARAALVFAGVTAGDVAALLVASSTGHLVPTLDLHLAARLGLAAAARRLALNDLGCVGALRAVATAADLVRGGGVALIVAVELSSLWLPSAEPSPADLRAAMVFGDGAAALVLDASGEAVGPQLLASRSVLWPDSLEARGAVQTGAGLRHVVSPRLPRTVVATLRHTIADFLHDQQLAFADLAFVAINPSELELARSIAAHLDLDPAAVELPRAVWEQHGNTLAVGPLNLLRGLAEGGRVRDGDLGLLLAVGPGLTCDLTLLRWHPLALEGAAPSAPVERG